MSDSGNEQPQPSTTKRLQQKSTKDEVELCNELRQWFTNHSGKRPRRIGLERSLIRRTRAVNIRLCLRHLNAPSTGNSQFKKRRVSKYLGTSNGTTDQALFDRLQ